VTYRAW